MRALVTGGVGFIGSHLVEALIRQGDEVVVLDDLSSGHVSYLDDRAQLVVGRVESLDDVGAAIDGCEVVFHLAALRSVARSVDDPLATNLANAHGTLTVLSAARAAGVRRVVSSSSSSVYGGADLLPTPEDAPLVPRSPYAVSKLAAEHHCRVYAELFGLETVSLRYFNVYGPRQDPDSPYAAVIPLFASAVMSGEAPSVHGDGLQTRDFTFVSDAVAANLRAAAAPARQARGHAYNIAGGEPWSLLQLLEHLGHLAGCRPEPTFEGLRSGDVRHTWADTRAAEDHLGHRPLVGMEEGLAATFTWLATKRTPAGETGVAVSRSEA